jgi:two-component system LytT family response regulator
MPGKNGFDLLQSLPQRRFEIVFVTAFDQYGIQAVKFSAIDYLLKPVNTSELQLAVEKAILKSAIKTENLQLQNLVTLLQQRQQKSVHRLVLSTAKETKFVNPEEIIRCESSNTYTSFYIVGEQKIMVSKPIFEYEELLKDYGFIRCHQSHLINMAKVKSWLKENGSELLLQDGSRVPVSRNKKEIVAAALKTFKLP